MWPRVEYPWLSGTGELKKKTPSANDSRPGRDTNEVPPKRKSDVSPLDPTCHSQKVGQLIDTGFIQDYPVKILCRFYTVYSVHYDVSNSLNTSIFTIL